MSEVSIWAVLSDVAAERHRQDARWGEQNHPNLPPSKAERMFPGALHRLYARKADDWKIANDARARLGTLAWDGILLEEVYEAVSERDPKALYEELIQVAAVATCWAEALKRKEEARRG